MQLEEILSDHRKAIEHILKEIGEIAKYSVKSRDLTHNNFKQLNSLIKEHNGLIEIVKTSLIKQDVMLFSLQELQKKVYVGDDKRLQVIH